MDLPKYTTLMDHAAYYIQMRDDVQKKKVNYEAMNEQLLEDLPQLYNLSLSVVTDCLCRLLHLFTSFHAEASETVARLGQVCTYLHLAQLVNTTTLLHVLSCMLRGSTPLLGR